MKYARVQMLDMESYSGYIPNLATARGHPTDGTTVLVYESDQAPEGLDYETDIEALLEEFPDLPVE